MSDALLTESVLTLGTLFRLYYNTLTNLAHEMVVKRLSNGANVRFRVNISSCILQLLLFVPIYDEINIRILEFSVVVGFSFHFKFKFNMKS